MPPRALACPKCKTKLTAPEGAERFRCPRCKTVLAAPPSAAGGGPGEGASEAPPPAPFPQAAEEATATPLPEEPGAAPAEALAETAVPEAPAGDEQGLVGRQLGSYQVTRCLGRGGLGTVYEALQEGLNRRVALKVLPPEAAADPAFLAAFRRVAQAAAKLNHPNLVQIFDIVEDQGVHFFAMEFVDGESLAARIAREGRLAPAEAIPLVTRVAAALEHAYEQMLLHRDLKPANLLLTKRGDVKLADLGLTKSLEQSTIGVVEGTAGGPVYMAPEFARAPQLADCRSDIYSLGCVLFHALTGQPPFPGPSTAELLQQHATAPFPSAKALVPDIPQAVDALLKKMCAKDPAERFQTHTELATHLQSVLLATTVRAPHVEREGKPKDHKALVVATAAALATVALLAILLLSGVFRSKPRQATVPPITAPKLPAEPAKPKDEELPPEFPPDKTLVPAVRPPSTTPTPKAETPPQAKAEPKEEPPRKAAPATWQAKLDEARPRAEVEARAGHFAKAIAALEDLAKADNNADLRTAVADAANALRRQAADACRVALQAAKAHADKGEYPQAREALQNVIEHFGTPDEVKAAQAALHAVNKHEQLRTAAARAATEATAAAQATQRRAELQAQLAQALEPIEEQTRNWKLAEAAAALAALKVEDKALAAQVGARKAAVDALLDLRRRIIHHIKTAQPPLDKRALRITGLNGPLTDATEAELSFSVAFGAETRVEKLPWAKLKPASAELLAERVARRDSAPDALATALLLQLLGDEEKAKTHRERAAALDANLAPPAAAEAPAAPAEAKAAQALADALAHVLAGRHQEAQTALDAYQKDFADTEHFKGHKDTFELAKAYQPIAVPQPPTTPTPPKPVPPEKGPVPPKAEPKAAPKAEPKAAPKAEPKAAPVDAKALALYQNAVQAFNARDFDAAKKALDDLKAQFPQSPLHQDAARQPSVPALLQALAARGPRVVVSKDADGAVRSLAAAFANQDKPSLTVLVEPGTYAGGVTVPGDVARGLVLRGAGEKPPRLDGQTRRVLLRFPSEAADLWLERLELSNAETALFLGPNCSATLRDLIALEDVACGLDKFPTTPVTLHGCVLPLSGLTAATAAACAFACDETPLDHGSFTACLLVGPEIGLLNVTLTDCLLLGPVTLLGGNQLNHVTIIGEVSIPEDCPGNAITNSIVESITTWKPDPRAKEKPAVALTIKCTAVARLREFNKDLVKADDKVKEARVEFTNPTKGDYRLAADSGLRGKAADQTDLGCRFPPEMLDLLKRAKRFPTLLHPPARKHGKGQD